MIEKRAAPRHRVLKHGTLAFVGGGGVDCMVRNISSSGARLDVASPVGLPATFMLVIQTDQFMRRCRPVWSNDNRIGVAFD
jgi:PilZ domain-containing protein